MDVCRQMYGSLCLQLSTCSRETHPSGRRQEGSQGTLLFRVSRAARQAILPHDTGGYFNGTVIMLFFIYIVR